MGSTCNNKNKPAVGGANILVDTGLCNLQSFGTPLVAGCWLTPRPFYTLQAVLALPLLQHTKARLYQARLLHGESDRGLALSLERQGRQDCT